MEFNSMIESHRSQIRFYQLLCIGLVATMTVLAVIVPSSLKTGPYIVNDSGAFFTVSRSEPWKVSVARIEGFLKLFLTSRFEWSNESFEQRKATLKQITTDKVLTNLKDSIASYSAIAKSQDAKSYYLLEGFRFAHEKHVIEAQVSRVIRVGATGVVTPLFLRLFYEDAPISEGNPYGLRVTAIEEGDLTVNTGVSK